MKYKTILSGQTFVFDSVKEVLAKAGEHKSGDVLAGVAAQLAVAAGVIAALFHRWKEIRGGEEDEAKKY